MPIEPGLTGEMTLIVQESDTARFSGGESLPPVFSTPRVIGLLERTSHNTILPFLAEGQGSVGAVVNIRHLAATRSALRFGHAPKCWKLKAVG